MLKTIQKIYEDEKEKVLKRESVRPETTRGYPPK